ncbi:MAG TPA: hypothetical protein VHG30_16855 [Microvirga sp.]|nr:hypothetical protein [Microvirga sp.]
MHMTRPQARSSFTFEIKRANRRTSEILTLSKTSSRASSSLAEQVFGSSPARPAQPPALAGEDRARPNPSLLGSGAREAAVRAEPSADSSPRRVLPDLLSARPNPVEERLRQEAEERSARQRLARAKRQQFARQEPFEPEAVPAPDNPSNRHDSVSAVAGPAATGAPLSIVADESSSPAAPRGRAEAKGSVNLRAKCRRAHKLALPLPRLAAGERWKRRLPWMCW